MRIRDFNMQTDYREVRHLWETAGQGVQLSPSDEPEEVAKKVKRDPDLFLVAEKDGRLVGVVLGGYDGRRGMMYHLAVEAGSREEGIGRRLVEELERRLRQKGCLKYYLLVTKDNHDALTFYEKLGCEMMELYVLGKVLR
jgi:ribosomal protein S18 acetylase RimI-like enzyme